MEDNPRSVLKSNNSVNRICQVVINDVINGVRDEFLDECGDESVLDELKQLWENKLFIHRSTNQKSAIPESAKQSTTVTKLMHVRLAIPNSSGEPKLIIVQVPESALINNQITPVLTGPVLTAAMNLPSTEAATLIQNHYNRVFMIKGMPVQLDGANDPDADNSSDSMNELIDAKESSDEGAVDAESDHEQSTPLNSEDDLTDEEGAEKFESDNLILCQFEKILRVKNKWKFNFTKGIMNVDGEDYFFNQAAGEAEW